MAAILLDDDADMVESTLSSALLDTNNNAAITDRSVTTYDPLASSTWEEIPSARTLITPVQCKSLWGQFKAETEYSVTQAISAQEANKRNNIWLPPQWAIVGLVVLGFNEFKTLSINPFYLGFIFVVFLLIRALWVQLDIAGEFQHGAEHGVPLNHINMDNAQSIGNMFMTLKETYLESFEDGSWKRFFHLRVLVNLQKSPLTGFFSRKKDGSLHWIYFKYEKLGDFCFKCGMIGHSQLLCKGISSSPSAGYGNSSKFGPWLRANYRSQTLSSGISHGDLRATGGGNPIMSQDGMSSTQDKQAGATAFSDDLSLVHEQDIPSCASDKGKQLLLHNSNQSFSLNVPADGCALASF